METTVKNKVETQKFISTVKLDDYLYNWLRSEKRIYKTNESLIEFLDMFFSINVPKVFIEYKVELEEVDLYAAIKELNI